MIKLLLDLDLDGMAGAIDLNGDGPAATVRMTVEDLPEQDLGLEDFIF